MHMAQHPGTHRRSSLFTPIANQLNAIQPFSYFTPMREDPASS
jgi:hypothetical protein